MNLQETIIGKIAQAKAIKQAMSFDMPREIFKAMNNHWDNLIDEAMELNKNSDSNNWRVNIELINDVINTQIVEKY